ncbi:hypothetical protein AB0395_45365 [Streptosporangium sp. NPDC051023]|uniref:hypothetical protein n=1 Tax=Streptosporangium sp. NPDC051023 TaxID=3155410 RepID=UPI00344E68FF
MSATIVPAERVRPGIAVQRVNVFQDGVFIRQMRSPGTIEQARAYAAVLPLGDTHPDYLTLFAAYLATKTPAV